VTAGWGGSIGCRLGAYKLELLTARNCAVPVVRSRSVYNGVRVFKSGA